LDFADKKARAVIICGIPFPPAKDPKVLIKKRILDDARLGLSGAEWYKQQASRAVNQAIGRVIRHRRDYGAILLCDARFGQPGNIQQLPVWVRPHVHLFRSFGDVQSGLIEFFKNTHIPNETKTIVKRFESRPIMRMKQVKENVKPQEIKQPKGDAQEYLFLLKSHLSSGNYKSFQKTLQQYKKKNMNAQEMIETILPLFKTIPDSTKQTLLVTGFKQFVSSKFHAFLIEYWNQLN
jgi:hypothetical protein